MTFITTLLKIVVCFCFCFSSGLKQLEYSVFESRDHVARSGRAAFFTGNTRGADSIFLGMMSPFWAQVCCFPHLPKANRRDLIFWFHPFGPQKVITLGWTLGFWVPKGQLSSLLGSEKVSLSQVETQLSSSRLVFFPGLWGP